MRRVVLVLLSVSTLVACTETVKPPAAQPPKAHAPAPPGSSDLLAGMPDYPDRTNVYAAAGANMLREDVRADRELVYVPNTNSDQVYVIDPNTFQVVDQFYGG